MGKETNDSAFLTKEEADGIYITKDECIKNRMEVLERIIQEEKKNIEQDGKLNTLEQCLNKINSNFSKIAWIGITIIIESLLGLIIK